MKINLAEKNRYLIAAGVVFSFVLVYSAVSVFIFSDERVGKFHVNVMDEELVATSDDEESVENGELEVLEGSEQGEYVASGVFGRRDKAFEGGSPFKDVPDDHKSAPAVSALYYKGIFEGYTDGTFMPDRRINRAEFVKLLVEAANVDFADIDSSKLENCFADVAEVPDHWFAPFVCAAKHKGWVSGYADGHFYPERDINKAEGLKLILDVFGFEIPDNNNVVVMPYSDVSYDDWYFGVAKAGRANNLISTGETFNASWRLTRGDVARMFYEAMRGKGLL